MNNSYILYNIRLQWHTSSSGCDSLQVRPRGATPRPRSGADARRTPCPRGSSQKELPHRPRSGQWPRVPGCDSSEAPGRSYPTRGQGQQPGGATPGPRSGGCLGTGGPRGATPHSRSGGVAAGRSNPMSKEQWLPGHRRA